MKQEDVTEAMEASLAEPEAMESSEATAQEQDEQEQDEQEQDEQEHNEESSEQASQQQVQEGEPKPEKKRRKKPKRRKKRDRILYTHCLNCGVELNGKFCHNCGQPVVSTTPPVMDFVMEYVINAFIWDVKFVQTVKNLLCKPGFLSKEFQQGKFTSYTHPLKLNMFLLLVFVTLFLIFSDTSRIGGYVEEMSTEEVVFADMTLSSLQDNEEFAAPLAESERDTVLLYITPEIAEKFPTLVEIVDKTPIQNSKQDTLYHTILPRMLITEKILCGNEVEGYLFDVESEYAKEQVPVKVVSDMWKRILNLLTQYFPVIILLTVPFLSFANRTFNRKYKWPRIHSFVFTLHYTAFLELMLVLIYLSYLAIPASRSMLDWIFAIAGLVYLTFALHRFYGGTSWFVAGLKSLLINLTYLFICLVALIIIFIAVIISLVIEMADEFA